MEEAKGGVRGAAMGSVGWLVQWSVSILGLEISPSIRRGLTFSFSRTGGGKNTADVPFFICSSDVGFSLTPELLSVC